MECICVSVVKLIALLLIFITCIRQSLQADINCIPIENCPSLINILEKYNYSPEAVEFLSPYTCHYSNVGFYIWCPDFVKGFDRFHLEHVPENEYPPSRDLAVRGPSITQNSKQHHSSKGFIWRGTTASKNIDSTTQRNFFLTEKSEVTTKNTVLSAERILPFTKKDSKSVPKEISESQSRIYFPDEDLGPIFARINKSRILDDLSSTCGRSFYQDYESSANHTAGLGEFPWMALLAYDIDGVTVPNCAGTLISSRHVLTAASCLHQNDVDQWNLGELLQVVLGELDTSTYRDCVKLPFGERCGDQTVKVGVKSIVIHPDFRGVIGFHDIAILKLEKEVEFSDFITPICLPEEGFVLEPRHSVITANWQKNPSNNGYIMKKSEVKLIGSRINPIQVNDFCTGFPGSPIMIQKSEELGSPYYLIRIDAGGVKSKDCGDLQSPSIFVPGLRKWIDDNID